MGTEVAVARAANGTHYRLCALSLNRPYADEEY